MSSLVKEASLSVLGALAEALCHQYGAQVKRKFEKAFVEIENNQRGFLPFAIPRGLPVCAR